MIKHRGTVNYGKLLEDKLEALLIELKLPYTREGSKKQYGLTYSNKGKFDFLVNYNIAIECKSIGKDTDLRLPWPNTKNTAIGAHQLKALRAEAAKNHKAGLLLEVRKTQQLFWLEISELDAAVSELGIIPALTTDVLNRFGQEIKNLKEVLNYA